MDTARRAETGARAGGRRRPGMHQCLVVVAKQLAAAAQHHRSVPAAERGDVQLVPHVISITPSSVRSVTSSDCFQREKRECWRRDTPGLATIEPDETLEKGTGAS